MRDRPLLRDRVLLGLAGLTVAVVLWFLLGPGGGRSSWLIQTGLDVTLVFLSRRLAALCAAQPAARRFWRSMTVTAVCCAAGDGYQSVLVLLHPAATVSTVQTVLVVLGMSGMVVTMLRHPLGADGRQRLRLWLDAATVMAGVAVFLWYFSIGAELGSDHLVDRLATAAVSAVMLVIVLGVLKLILSDTAPFTLLAGVIGSIGTAGTAVGASVATVLTGASNPRIMTVAQLIPCILVVFSLRLQELQTRRRPAGRRGAARGRFSRMPYLAVIATQVLLVVALTGIGPGVRIWGVTAGVVVITLLVLTRQLAAFHDNDRLLTDLHVQKEWFSSLVQHASDVTIVVDAQDTVTYASPAAVRVLGTDPAQALGAVLRQRVHPDDVAAFDALPGRLATAPAGQVAAQLRLRHADGGYRWLDVIGADLRAHPSVRGVVYNARDITEARALQDKLRHQATHDTLTGLANRALLGERLQQRTGGQVSVLVIDLDGFKAINDGHGHHAGDHVLTTVAARLTALLHPGDLAVRLGGDEFAVVPADPHPDRAGALSGQIVAALSAPVDLDGRALPVGGSVGVATGPAGDPDRLLRDADAAMYRTKQDRKAAAV
ncbi:GGDEF domain-containing protein [Dactylosporangium aurantiacum]|uniref:GGDEF domain-containing protein n=1 Tax=Dactylosporangium aurantiacum TaxID=35754 RepID=A0A9Q9IBB2_9ACTN|nr:sensor domain-containing diguanylate cyclase [Dactylosporangium aurantiacum]MDG6106705.1 sensor domain-containing diguanylate cyclase [Dactylosporangium aurantiacum]UWZ50857.1 GGDEF domain-containing protein [Dactylosporangium aurantiacum]